MGKNLELNHVVLPKENILKCIEVVCIDEKGHKIEFKNIDNENIKLEKVDDKMFLTLEIKRDCNGNFGYIKSSKIY